MCVTLCLCVCVCLDFFNFLFLQALGFWVVFCVRFFLPLSFQREREKERDYLSDQWYWVTFKGFQEFWKFCPSEILQDPPPPPASYSSAPDYNSSESKWTLLVLTIKKKKLDREIISQVVCTSLCVVCVVWLFQIRKLRSLVFISPKSGFVEVRKTSCLQSLDQALSFLSLLFNIVVYFSLIFSLLDCGLFVVFQKLQETSQFFSLSPTYGVTTTPII